jgi:protein-L-isoaspartate O-methyltransferase
LKAGRKEATVSRPNFSALAVGSELILAPHPIADFVYVDTSDLLSLPHIVAGTYQARATAVLEQVCSEATDIVHLGAGCGYHTLTMATQLHGRNRVIAIETDDQAHETLRLNVRTHGLDDVIDVVEVDRNGRSWQEEIANRNVRVSHVYVTGGAVIHKHLLDGLDGYLRRNPAIELWRGYRRVTLEELSALPSFSTSSICKYVA